jgi:cell division protease FtsH
VRNLFKQARENKPSIIFIDEIDSIGRQRGAGINMGNDEREQTLNQLLAEMDGFAQNDQVLVIAATNRKDVLDAALLRPGRFDRIVNVPLPDTPSRAKILEVHMRNKQFTDDVNVEFLAELSGGFSGAQLKNLINEAAINAARTSNTVISQANILSALEKLVVGIVKRNDTRSEKSLSRVAFHEIGHAFLANYFNEYFDLKKVTIQSTYNGAGGYTLFNEYPEILESGLYTKDLLKKRLVVAMGGKAAEYVFYGDENISLGAIQDLKQANGLAQQMIGNYGMGKDLEVFYNENVESNRNPFLGRSMGMGDRYSEKTKEILDKESLELVNTAYNDAKTILMKHKDKMDVIVDELMKSYTLYGKDIKKIME